MMRIKRRVIWKETNRRWMGNTTMDNSTVMVAIDHSITTMKLMTLQIMEKIYRTVVSRSIY